MNSSISKYPVRNNGQLEEMANSLFKQLKVPSIILVNLDAVAHNVKALRKVLGPKTEVMAVVKGDAYNIGLLPAVKVLLEEGIRHLAVATVSEGVHLRKNGVQVAVTVLGNLIEDEVKDILEYDLMPSLSWDKALRGLSKGELMYLDGRRLRVNINIDTGMSRYGVQPEDLAELVKFLDGLEVEIYSMYTHLSGSEEDLDANKKQLDKFLNVTEPYKHRLIHRHVANSTGCIQGLGIDLNFVRVGSCIFGIGSASDMIQYERLGFQLPLSVFSRPTFYELLPPGKKVGLHATYKTTKLECIANFRMGWSYKCAQNLINRGAVRRLRTGEQCPVVGFLPMGSIAVKLPEVPGPGEVFQVLSDDYNKVTSYGTMWDMTEAAIIEDISLWSTQMPRIYINGDSVTEVCQPFLYTDRFLRLGEASNNSVGGICQKEYGDCQ
ncbi:alanine racemase-like [Oratosquilla oratoria]|uniref:alanine racemase-like n=1 Tax=Oratosquilla oratoria TaxID=337810 RepID=UPI003F75CB58